MISANLTNAVRKAVYKRDGYTCALCDSNRGLQIHHVVPRSEGGTNAPHNLITLCWRCHAVAHGTRMPEYADWMGPEELQQACVEYVADYYASLGFFANPWSDKLLTIAEVEEMRRIDR